MTNGQALARAALSTTCVQCRRLYYPADGFASHSSCPACSDATDRSSASSTRPHLLTHAAIDAAVKATSAGSFALGYLDGAEFRVFYVGRADQDTNEQLHEWVDKPSRARRHVSSAKAPWGTRARGRYGAAPSLDRVGVGADTAYTHFAFRYARSPAAAFDHETRDYHTFGGSDCLDNERHPVAPDGSCCGWLGHA
jgi:hypothetical protein